MLYRNVFDFTIDSVMQLLGVMCDNKISTRCIILLYQLKNEILQQHRSFHPPLFRIFIDAQNSLETSLITFRKDKDNLNAP